MCEHLGSGNNHGEGIGNRGLCRNESQGPEAGIYAKRQKQASACMCIQTRGREHLWRPGSVSPPALGEGGAHLVVGGGLWSHLWKAVSWGNSFLRAVVS